MTLKGACLCGESTIELNSKHNSQVICHCLDCKRTSGSAFSTNVLVPRKDVKIMGPTKTYGVTVANGNLVSRIFCGNCGSAISHDSVGFGDAQAIQTGNFKDFANVPFDTELFVKDRWSGIAAIPDAQQFEQMSPA
ncbi:hypothetical protein BDN72DRAFT_148620 [Pluteus cervinus]|uniref:Uncharacterized protein n=1 Tax=Pluteus cervinus TaxID=181527 RepID=A0ACD3AKC7_9AGAR|nr:hypothetical protein BDN72DRAFT_148620 [Pluteus cervinus]